MDMTFFVLIVRLTNNVRLKILETKNATKIRKEVSNFHYNSTQPRLTYFYIYNCSLFVSENSLAWKSKSWQFMMRLVRKTAPKKTIDTMVSQRPINLSIAKANLSTKTSRSSSRIAHQRSHKMMLTLKSKKKRRKMIVMTMTKST